MSQAKRVLLWVMGIFYVVAGANHFLNPDFYMPMMPPYLPAHRELVFLSGLAEVVLGAAVLPIGQPLAAWGIILLLLAVYPANIHIALHNVPLGGAPHGAGVWNWVRLPFQIVLIAWAWWYTRDAERRGQPSTGDTPPSVSKPAILRRMDRLARDPKVMEAALHDLQTQPDKPLLDLGLLHQYVETAGGEAEHLRKDWFDHEHGWWQHLPAIEPIARAALIKAGELAVERRLPVDCYWIQGHDTFEVAICVSDVQITLLFMSPNIPPIVIPGAAKRVARDNLWTVKIQGGAVQILQG